MVLIALFCTIETPSSKKPVIVTKSIDLGHISFIKRKSYEEVLHFLSREISPNVDIDVRNVVLHENYKIFILKRKNPNFCYIAICDDNYNDISAFRCISEFESLIEKQYKEDQIDINTSKDLNIKLTELKDLLAKYRKYQNVNKIEKAQETFDELNDLVTQNLEKLINNENIDQLLKESEDLKENTKIYLKQTKKMKKCC